MIITNDIIHDVHNDLLYRVLWISQNREKCWLIVLETKSIKLINFEMNILDIGVDSGDYKIADESYSSISSDSYFKNEKIAAQINIAYDFIQRIASHEMEPKCFNSQIRRKSILKIIDEYDFSEKTAKKYLRKYWQGGKTRLSLAPEYSNCGYKNKYRITDKNNNKLGRKSAVSKANVVGEGINIDDEIREMIKLSISRNYNKNVKQTIKSSYHWMLERFFSIERFEDGAISKRIKPPDEIPTFGQYKYWFYKLLDCDESIKKREGDKAYQLRYRELKSDSLMDVDGPGSKYQIDSTLADVNLVSSIDNSYVGRPVLYFAIDVFSRLITGIHVCLEGPSKEGAASLIYNCFEDKKEFCKKYEIDIEEHVWPSKGLPRTILADRGETVGPNSEEMINGLGIEVENTPSYRGDAKGLVEQLFRIFNIEAKKWMSGTVDKKYRERGDRDPRKDSNLTLRDFTKMVIRTVIHRNLSILNTYPLNGAMVKDNVRQIPAEIWKWGIENHSGCLFTLEKETVLRSLMRRGLATVSHDGIHFKNAIYSCKIAEDNMWFSKARREGVWHIQAIYDTRDNYKIFIIDDYNNRLIPCSLSKLKTVNDKYFEKINYNGDMMIGKSFEEIEKYIEVKKLNKHADDDYTNQLQLELDTDYKNIIENIEKSTPTKSDLKDTKSNRKRLREHIGQSQALTNKVDDESDYLEEDFSFYDSNDEIDTTNPYISKISKLRKGGIENEP